jgi:hypothetical protein
MRENTARSKNLELFILLNLCLDALNIIINNVMLFFLSDNPDTYNTVYVMSNYLSYVEIALTIATATFFIMWFRRAYFNLHEIGVGGLRYSETMARNAWFIPFTNLIVPLRIMQDIWIETQRAIFKQNQYKENKKISAWWFAWIVQVIASRIFSSMYRRAETIEAINEANYVGTFMCAMKILCGILLISILRDLRSYETTLYDSRTNQQDSILFGTQSTTDENLG